MPLDKNKGGQQSVGADITAIAKDVGFRYHARIIWNEGYCRLGMERIASAPELAQTPAFPR